MKWLFIDSGSISFGVSIFSSRRIGKIDQMFSQPLRVISLFCVWMIDKCDWEWLFPLPSLCSSLAVRGGGLEDGRMPFALVLDDNVMWEAGS